MGLQEKAIAAFEATGYPTAQAFVDANPGKHIWFHDKWDCCALCGVIKPRDREPKPCRGIVRVTLRT